MFHISIHRIISILCLTVAVAGMSTPSFSASEKPQKPTPVKLVKASQVVENTININEASAEAISERLKGIGLKKAQAIVEWRTANGKFTSIEQLMEVKGIGEKTLAANKDKITL